MADINFLAEHRTHFGTAYFVALKDVNMGDVVTFSYDGKIRYAFVVDPNYEGKMHALTLEHLPRNILATDVVNALFVADAPEDLYHRSIYRVAKETGAYRTYIISKIRNIRRLPYNLKTPKEPK